MAVLHEDASTDAGAILKQVVSDLEYLNRHTEQDFLAIGGKLVEFLGVARQVSADMAALAELISGSYAGHASQVLTTVLERTKRTEARAEEGDRVLAGVCRSTVQMERTLRGLGRTISVFRVLGSLTRIETARLGHKGAEFGKLADDVNALTRRIEASGQGIVNASSMLQQDMQAALNTITSLRAGELKELPSLIAGVMSSLGSLQDQQARAKEASLRQVAEFEQVSAAIEDLISAIQFQDITRQQVEHVTDALKELHSAPASRSLLKLQSSQLSNAGQVFASSVDRIRQALGSIADRVRYMAEASTTLISASANEEDSFFLQMEGRFTAILNVVTACTESEAETQATLARLEKTVKQMRVSVAEVRVIENRIRGIAINAMIRAAEIGDPGKALNVIAEIMQGLARDSHAITEEVAGALDSVTGSASQLSGGSGWMTAGDGSDTDPLLSEMRTAISEVRSSNQRSSSRLSQIAELSSRLGRDIHSVQGGFSAGAAFAAAIDRARRALDKVKGPTGVVDGIAERRYLEELASRYTMQGERDIHEAVTGCAVTVPGEPAGVPGVVAGEDELGENVDFF